MNPQLKSLLTVIRKGIETNVKSTLRNMEVTREKDIKILKKKLDEIRGDLRRVEALKPYVAAVEAAVRTARRERNKAHGTTRRKAAKRSRARKRKS